jgi:hypothetical protein
MVRMITPWRMKVTSLGTPVLRPMPVLARSRKEDSSAAATMPTPELRPSSATAMAVKP